ncbi:MAG: lipase family protein [Chloroflexota bacterium]|nr:lipase family protein [Chloroflexota bacterium]
MRAVLPWLALGLLMSTPFTGVASSAVAGQEASTPELAVQALLPIDVFYDPPAQITAAPGTLLRSEPLVDRVLPAGSQAWRMQYVTTMPDGSPTMAVATVLAPSALPAAPMPVIAWDHGTVGLVQRCLPSLTTVPFAAIPAVPQAVAAQWVVVAPDYQPDANGIHPFLIGEGEARSTLDAVRAARQLPGLALDPRTILWGHSQGGHAALWTTMLAPIYAPDITLAGTVAIAPAADLRGLLEMHGGDAAASGIGAFLVNAYSAYYPEVSYDAAVRPTARETGRDLAMRCPLHAQDAPAMTSRIEGLGGESLLAMPLDDALAARLAENTPQGPFAVPVLIAQGLDDDVVFPSATDAWVAARCQAGATLEYWRLPGQDHRGIVAPGSPLEDPLMAWTQQRFAGDAPPEACTEATITG